MIMLKGLFLAYGSDFAQNKEVEPFENIELYNLMARKYSLKLLRFMAKINKFMHKYGVCSNGTCSAFSFNASYKRTDFLVFCSTCVEDALGHEFSNSFYPPLSPAPRFRWAFVDGPTNPPTNLAWRTVSILNFVKF